MKLKIKNGEKYFKLIFVISVFILALTWAIIMPNDSAPDEHMKITICKYIAENGKLPHGGDEAIRDSLWGISYAFSPILSYIIGGGFVKIASLFTQDMRIHYIAARLVSVICYTIMTIFIIKIAEKLFKKKSTRWVFIFLTTLMPQVTFLGSYINNDSLALMSISIIVYAWLIGLETKWDIKSCITLAVGIGICALSYYNAYSFILTSVIIFVLSFIINKKDDGKVDIKNLFKKGIIISIISILIFGWWFIRSAIIYDGDFLGLNITDEYAEKYAIDELKPSKRKTPANTGMSLYTMLFENQWIRTTIKSFIGVFGYMDVYMGPKFYYTYILIFAIGIIGYLLKFYKFEYIKELKKAKEKILLETMFILNIGITIMLSIIYSYSSDFQPQGRYIMPILIPLMYFITLGIDNITEKYLKNEKLKIICKAIIIILVVTSSIVSLLKIIRTY